MAVYQEPPYATPLQRGIAYLLDVIIVVLIWTFYDVAAFGGKADVGDPMRLLSLLLLHFLYFIGFMVLFRATPAKMALGMRIVLTDGAQPQPPRLLARYVVFLITVVVPFGPIVSGIYMLRNPQRQALHDSVAGTVVLRTR